MVVNDYLRRFARFQTVASSKQQCTGLTGCYQYVSGSGEPNVVVCAGTEECAGRLEPVVI